MRPIRSAALALLLPALLVLAACAPLNLEQARSFEDRLAYAYASHTAVLEATTRSLNAGDISSATAEGVLEQADHARSLLDAARLTAEDRRTAGEAEANLVTALSILNQLQLYLREGP